MSEIDPRLTDATRRPPRPDSSGPQGTPPQPQSAPPGSGPGPHGPASGGPPYGAPAGPSPYGAPAGSSPHGAPAGGPYGVSGGPSHGGPSYGGPSHDGPSYGGPSHGGPPYGGPSPSYGGPSYGGPASEAAHPLYASPAPAAPGPVRPRVLWIVLAWLVAVICGVVGIVGFAGGLFKTITDAAPTQTFQSGGSVSVPMDPKDKPILYASASGPTDINCLAVDGAGKKVDLTSPKASQTVSADGRVWEAVFDIGVPAAGTYKVSCQAEAGKQVLFGVGKSLTADTGALAGGVASLFLIPLAGFLLAVVTTIVVLVRRGRNRKRQAAAAAPYGAAWPQGAPPQA
ncbi:hypothetical protein ABZU32_01000 [Sphaerisporangium sp. NPDC005288]|uniref:hypothetical protein n=1 Tax=Sphaerisporangium sp. NPDC005288 TaxID=3155114 RepID=UPI0033A3B2F9